MPVLRRLLLSLIAALLPGVLSAAPNTLDLAVIRRDLDVLVPQVMRKEGVVGAQVSVFDGARGLDLVYGHRDPAFSRPVTADTLFQAGDLVRPVTAYVVLRQSGAEPQAELTRPVAERLADFPIRPESVGTPTMPVTMAGLLTMSAGLPASRDGLLRPDAPVPDAAAYLRERLVVRLAPGTALASAPEGYAYLGRLVEAQDARRRNFDEITRATLAADFGLRDLCVERAGCPQPARITDGLVHDGSYYFTQPAAVLLYPAADSLYTTSAAYARFLRGISERNPVTNALFHTVFTYDMRLGGNTAGFHFLRTPAGPVYWQENRQPGFASLAILTADGRGAVILANSTEPRFLLRVRRYLLARFGVLPAELAPGVPAEAADWEGTYRPLYALPDRARWVSLLTEVRIRRVDEGLAIKGVFEKDLAGTLHATEEAGVYLARGETGLDGWRFVARRDADGDIVGLDSDLLRYERVSPVFSAWAILTYLALLVALPVLLWMLILIRRTKSAQS